MGPAIEALRETGRVLAGRPGVVLATVATGLLAPVLAFGFGRIPYVGELAYVLAVQPALLGGLLHLSDSAVNGPVDAGTYVEGVTTHYVRLVGAFLLVGVCFLAVGAAGALFLFVVGFTAAVDLTTGLILVTGVFVVLGFLLQFVDVAVVVGDAQGRGSLGQSVATIRRHPVSVLGYSLVRGLSVGVVLVGALVFLEGRLPVADVTGAEPIDPATATVLLVLGVVGYAGVAVYHAIYFRHAGLN